MINSLNPCVMTLDIFIFFSFVFLIILPVLMPTALAQVCICIGILSFHPIENLMYLTRTLGPYKDKNAPIETHSYIEAVNNMNCRFI